jgi:hypothetical protein
MQIESLCRESQALTWTALRPLVEGSNFMLKVPDKKIGISSMSSMSDRANSNIAKASHGKSAKVVQHRKLTVVVEGVEPPFKNAWRTIHTPA